MLDVADQTGGQRRPDVQGPLRSVFTQVGSPPMRPCEKRRAQSSRCNLLNITASQDIFYSLGGCIPGCRVLWLWKVGYVARGYAHGHGEKVGRCFPIATGRRQNCGVCKTLDTYNPYDRAEWYAQRKTAPALPGRFDDCELRQRPLFNKYQTAVRSILEMGVRQFVSTSSVRELLHK